MSLICETSTVDNGVLALSGMGRAAGLGNSPAPSAYLFRCSRLIAFHRRNCPWGTSILLKFERYRG